MTTMNTETRKPRAHQFWTTADGEWFRVDHVRKGMVIGGNLGGSGVAFKDSMPVDDFVQKYNFKSSFKPWPR